MENKINSLQGKILKQIGIELKKRGVPKLIGLGDVIELNNV